MVDLVPVDYDPFSDSRITLIPVDHDPFNDSQISLVPVDHDPFSEPSPAFVPKGYEDTFVPPDPSQWPRVGTVPRIIVHPKQPPSAFDGIDGTAPGQAYREGSDDWTAPAPSAALSSGQIAPGTQPVANPVGFNPPATWPDPLAAYWSLMPASGAGAMAQHPPIFLGDAPILPTVNSFTPAWPQALPPWAGIQNAPTNDGSPDDLAPLGSSSLDPGSTFPPLPQSQPASAQPSLTVGRRPLSDYSTGEILGDAAKSFGLGVGQFGIQGAGFLGDARETIANGVQRAADYFAPGSAPNAGSKASDFLASYPLLRGPTSSQLQSAVESYTGPFYQPKTIVGDYARTAGEFVPGALLMPEGTLAANALRYGLLPAFSSETAGQLTQGTAAEPWARTLGAILGAGPGAWRYLARTRSAPKVAEPLAESELSPADQLAARRRAQLEVNKAAGNAWETEGRSNDLVKTQVEIQPQITVRSNGPSGLNVRLDAVGQDRTTGDIVLSDLKASKTARLTSNQKIVYPELETYGGVVAGKGKAPYVGGRRIPPTQVTIVRKPGR